MSPTFNADSDRWYLEGFIDDSSTMRRIPINPLPFRVGRRRTQSFVLSSDEVSKEHAEIFERASSLWIRDLGSTNGTFVNDEKIEDEYQLQEGDVVRFAAFEFRLNYEHVSDTGLTGETTIQAPSLHHLSKRLLTGTRDLPELLQLRAVVPHYQPIVALQGGPPLGYEVLGRGNYERLPNSPIELFRIASIMGREAELSELFRNEGVRVAENLDPDVNLFLNTHPTELEGLRLLESLRLLREEWSSRPITLEIHEHAITDLDRIRSLRSALTDLKIGLAFDDFGVGEPKYLEIADTPPDFLKFDARLILDIDFASAQRKQMVETLVRLARNLGIATVAEGVESHGEMEVCTQLGFDYAQGYFFGRPCAVTGL